jgi:hypothetical protein
MTIDVLRSIAGAWTPAPGPLLRLQHKPVERAVRRACLGVQDRFAPGSAPAGRANVTSANAPLGAGSVARATSRPVASGMRSGTARSIRS